MEKGHFPTVCQKNDLVLCAERQMSPQLLTHLAPFVGKGRVKFQPWDLKVGLKAQTKVCSSGDFTLANELIENHLRKQNCPTKEVTIYPFCVCFCFPCSNHNSLLLVWACQKMQRDSQVLLCQWRGVLLHRGD